MDAYYRYTTARFHQGSAGQPVSPDLFSDSTKKATECELLKLGQKFFVVEKPRDDLGVAFGSGESVVRLGFFRDAAVV